MVIHVEIYLLQSSCTGRGVTASVLLRSRKKLTT